MDVLLVLHQPVSLLSFLSLRARYLRRIRKSINGKDEDSVLFRFFGSFVYRNNFCISVIVDGGG